MFSGPSHRIIHQGNLIRVSLLDKKWRRFWREVEPLCAWYAIEPELLVAVLCVETALARHATGPDKVLHLMPPEVLASRTDGKLKPTDLPMPFALELAARTLSRSLKRFTRLSLALAAYHTDPGRVDDLGDAVLDDVAVRDYVQGVLSTLVWLCQTRPWRAWDAVPLPQIDQPFHPIRWRKGGERHG